MPRLSFLGAGLLSLLTVAFPLHAETPLIGAEAVIELSDASDASSDYRFEPIAVTGQPFTEAVRVTVNRAADPVHLVQVWTAKSAAAIKTGDTVRGHYYIRAEPVGGSTPEVPGYLQDTEGDWAQVAWLGSNPTPAWQRMEFSLEAERDHAAGAVSATFHLGKTPQVVEIGGLEIVIESDEPIAVPEPETTDPSVNPVANPLDPDLLQTLGPDAQLIIAGNRPAELAGPGESPAAELSRVTVDENPLGLAHAARVVNGTATEQPWHASITSPSTTAAIRKGDVLFGQLDIRGDSEKESGGGQFVGWLQSPTPSWTQVKKFEGSPGPVWSRRYFSTVATQDFPAGSVNLVLHLGMIPQEIEVGNMLLWNLGPDADVDALPKTRLTYDGRAPDAPWRAEARGMIDRHRKADLTVRVLDAQGQAVEDARVDLELTRHAYGFGTWVGTDPVTTPDPVDRERLVRVVDQLFNRVSVPAYGADWGWADPQRRSEYLDTARWAVEKGYQTKAHTLIWSRWDWSPPSWESYRDQPKKLRAEIEAYIREVLPQYAELGIEEIDLLNEPTGFHDIDDVITDPGLRASWFEVAHEVAPDMKLLVNEHTMLSAGGQDRVKQDKFAAIVQDLIDRGAPLHGIGMQGHMGEDFTPPTKLWEVLDRFGAYGLPIHITELDINTGDEQAQADYLRDFILAVFAHPASEAITLWGFWEPTMWIPAATLYRTDWSRRPAGDALHELLTETLHTSASLRTDATGQAGVRGFKGRYRVRVTRDGAESVATFELNGANDPWVVRLD